MHALNDDAREWCPHVGALQQQRPFVDTSDRIALLHNRPEFGHHQQLPGYPGRNLDVIAAENRARYGTVGAISVRSTLAT
jgi:hypothetical protein